MKILTPNDVNFGRCPSNCPRFEACADVALSHLSSLATLENTAVEDLEVQPTDQSQDRIPTEADEITLAFGGITSMPQPEPGCPRYTGE